MRTGTKRTRNTGRPNKDTRSFSDQAKRSPSKSKRPQTKLNGIENAKKSHQRYMILARAAEATGDATEVETLYQRAEHYLRLMRAQAI
ncbi:MAG: DUF4167 domain-containing protein [Alphaproteobacteria bacterium]|nr:DUF4167 domain-containing protein [Alphaproteobacteria bacterium]